MREKKEEKVRRHALLPFYFLPFGACRIDPCRLLRSKVAAAAVASGRCTSCVHCVCVTALVELRRRRWRRRRTIKRERERVNLDKWWRVEKRVLVLPLLTQLWKGPIESFPQVLSGFLTSFVSQSCSLSLSSYPAIRWSSSSSSSSWLHPIFKPTAGHWWDSLFSFPFLVCCCCCCCAIRRRLNFDELRFIKRLLCSLWRAPHTAHTPTTFFYWWSHFKLDNATAPKGIDCNNNNNKSKT